MILNLCYSNVDNKTEDMRNMNRSSFSALLQKLDDWRVHQHFKRVERVLRARDISQLSPALQRARQRHLDQLHTYAARGILPRNHERPSYAPCFIDRDGRECAVAHLVMVSGSADLAVHIAAVDNYAYVPQINLPELDDWAAKTGLTREELALIQPGYFFTLTDSTLMVAIAIWTAGLVTLLMNVVQMVRRRNEIVLSTIGFFVAIPLIMLSCFCLSNSGLAESLGRNPDTGWMGEKFLSYAAPLYLGALISLIIALLTGGLGLYRRRKFILASNEAYDQSMKDVDSSP
jgi:hypothetical protein